MCFIPALRTSFEKQLNLATTSACNDNSTGTPVWADPATLRGSHGGCYRNVHRFALQRLDQLVNHHHLHLLFKTYKWEVKKDTVGDPDVWMFSPYHDCIYKYTQFLQVE